MTGAQVFTSLFTELAEIMQLHAKTRTRSMANYVRGLSVKVRGINCHGNITAIRKNYGIADDMDTLAFIIQQEALNEHNPERFMDQRVKRAHDLAGTAFRPKP